MFSIPTCEYIIVPTFHALLLAWTASLFKCQETPSAVKTNYLSFCERLNGNFPQVAIKRQWYSLFSWTCCHLGWCRSKVLSNLKTTVLDAFWRQLTSQLGAIHLSDGDPIVTAWSSHVSSCFCGSPPICLRGSCTAHVSRRRIHCCLAPAKLKGVWRPIAVLDGSGEESSSVHQEMPPVSDACRKKSDWMLEWQRQVKLIDLGNVHESSTPNLAAVACRSHGFPIFRSTHVKAREERCPGPISHILHSTFYNNSK